MQVRSIRARSALVHVFVVLIIVVPLLSEPLVAWASPLPAQATRSGEATVTTENPPTTDDTNPGVGLSSLYPAEMDPPGSCGVPLGGPFGKDVEILLNDAQYELEPGWYPRAGIPCAACPDGLSKSASTIAAASLDTEKVAAVWWEDGVAGHEGELYYNVWDASQDVDAWGIMARNGPFKNGEGWTVPQYYATIHSGDIDDDGVDELLGRGIAGMYAFRFNVADNNWEFVTENGPFNNADGWWSEKYYATIHSANIDGEGPDELLGRAIGGMEAYSFNVTNTNWVSVAANGPFKDADGWVLPGYYATIHSGDIDGDGLDELLGRAATGMVAYRFNGSGWDLVAQGGPFPDAEGWGGDARYYATIHSANIDGDGVDELLGRHETGMVAYRFNGSGWDPVAQGGPFKNSEGWFASQYYATIHSGDIDGDGVDELLGRGAEGMVAYRFNGSGWDLVAQGGPFADGTGWDTNPAFYATIHSGDIDGDGPDELLGRAEGGMEAYRFSGSPGGWGGEEGWLGPTSKGLAPEGNPVLLATGGQGWEVYARDGAGQIQYRAWLSPTVFSQWQTVPGTMNVAADPVVVSRRPGNTVLFYRDSGGVVWFTEREGGTVWRTSPLLLTTQRVFLPFVTRAGSGAVASPSAGKPPERATLAVSAFVSELSAISRNENHLAVFGVDGLGQLWVKEWTSASASDWRDTQWVKLMAGVKQEKPAVASRHSNHLVVAVRNTSGVAHTIEWSAQTGWGAPFPLNKTFVGPLALAAAETDGLFLFGLNEQNLVRSLHWTVDTPWEEAGTGPKVGLQDQVISTVVRRPGDAMVFARTGGQGQGLWRHFTSQGRDLTPTDRSLTPPQDELYRNQVVARVGSQSYYLAADQEAGGTWEIEAHDLDGDVAQTPLILDEHPYVAGSPVAVVAGDLDFDGSDEIVVLTYAHPTATLTVLDLIVTNPETAPELSMVVTATVTETLDAPPAQDLSLAIADLDGDLRRNEVVLILMRGDPAPCPGGDPWHAVAKLYQFLPGTPAELQEQSNGFLILEDDLVHCDPQNKTVEWELETAAGRFGLSGDPGEQLAVVLNAERACNIGCEGVDGHVNTYAAETDQLDWTLTKVHGALAPTGGDPLEFPGSEGNLYRSAVATGDLDADGYDEIVAWYVDRLSTIDPNDLDGSGDPTIEQWTLEPKRPLNNAQYFQSPRSLALDDLDRDGRAEIVAAAWLQGANTADYGFRFALLELLGDGALALSRYGPAQPGREKGSVLVGDVDGDGLVSELVGCNTFGEYTVVAVVNGLPRWYENGQPVFDSTGSYSKEEGGGSGTSNGTTHNIGASLTLGFEREINVPFVGKVASFKASVTQDFLSSSGITEEREEIISYGSNFEFEEGPGIVVYNMVESSCYYYDVFGPASPQDTVRAMSCTPADEGDIFTLVTDLDWWHQEDGGKKAAGSSWVDVGHRAPGGALTNDLAEPGNYPPGLPVDEFLVLFEFPTQFIKPHTPSAGWYANKAEDGARTEMEHIETNTTVSMGVGAFGISVEGGATFGKGWDSSNKISWSKQVQFAGGYSWGDDDTHACYVVWPYVYQATAKTVAGVTYPYWVMDYYVTDVQPCP